MAMNRLQWGIIAVVVLAAQMATANVWDDNGTARPLTHTEAREVVDWFNYMRSKVTPTAGDLARMVSIYFAFI